MTDLTIRPATSEDLPMLRIFEQGLIEAERPFDPTIKEAPVRYYDLEKLLVDKDSEILVASMGSEIVACGMVLIAQARAYLNHENYANIRFLYTKPSYRGQGINALIIAQLAAWARQQNLSEIRLTVYQDNLSAIKAYQKVGFEKHIIEMRLA